MRYLYLLCAIGLLEGCVKDFKPQDTTSKLTLNAEFNNEDRLQLYLTEAIPVNGNALQQKAVSGAGVRLYENDVFLETLQFVPSFSDTSFGFYTCSSALLPGKKYEVKLEDPKYGKVSSADTMPAALKVNSYHLDSYNGSASPSKFAISFDDAAEDHDFYRLIVYIYGMRNEVNEYGDTVQAEFQYVSVPMPSQPLADTVRQYRSWMLFSDRTFNGSTEQLNFSFDAPDTAGVIWEVLDVELNAVSRSYYEYNRTLEIYRNSQFNAEPVHVFTNIKNGNGMFAAQTVHRMRLVVK